MSMGNFIKKTIKLFKFNLKPILIFSNLYTIFNSCIPYAVVNGLMLLAMRCVGINYIADNNIFDFITSPITWIAIIASCFIIAFLGLVFSCAIVYALNCSRVNRKVTVKELFIAGIDCGKKTFSHKNIMFVVYMVLLIPFVSSIELTSADFSIGIPGFILDAILSNRLYKTLFFIVLALLIILTYKLILVIPIFAIDGLNFKDATKKSKQLMKKQKLKVFVYDISSIIILILLVTLASFSIIEICKICSKIFNFVLFEYLDTLIIMVLVLIGLLIYKCIFLLIHTSFYFHACKKNGIEINSPKEVSIKRIDTVFYFGFVVLSIVLLCNIIDNTHLSNQIVPSIAAHRGDSVRAPENSLPAFQLAVDEGISSWVELDVHQTKDGVIVVSHDDYLGRIGIDLYVHDSTYEELMKHDSGAYFSPKFEGLRLCTLKQALEVMKDKVAVQIEIKPTEYDNHIEEAVLDIVKEIKSSKPIAVLSLKEKPLKRIKELDKNFPIIYCTIIATDGIEEIEYADAFSIEESCIDEKLVDAIHAERKKCFVWTINKKDNVQYLVDCGVDVILTDDPIMMLEALSECNYFGSFADSVEEYVNNYLNILDNIFD